MACCIGCMSFNEKHITYYVPQWNMYIRLTGSDKGYHKVLFSNDSSLFSTKKLEALDYIVLNDSYYEGEWQFMIVNMAKPDTLFVMSNDFNSISIPMKTISRQSSDPHFRIDGAYFKCEDGYFGFYIFPTREGIKLIRLSEKDAKWDLLEVERNCQRL